MRVFEIMSDRVVAVTPTASAADAAQKMRTAGVHHLVVLRDSELVGLVSARDIPDDAARKRGASVADLMQTSVATVGPNTLVTRAANLMAGRSIGSVVVTQRGKVVGIVTVSDLLRLVGQGAGRQPKRRARPLLKARSPKRRLLVR